MKKQFTNYDEALKNCARNLRNKFYNGMTLSKTEIKIAEDDLEFVSCRDIKKVLCANEEI